jgi:hypothetical protein
MAQIRSRDRFLLMDRHYSIPRGVERTVVALEMLLAIETARAESADEGLGGILSQGLLAALVSYQQASFPL